MKKLHLILVFFLVVTTYSQNGRVENYKPTVYLSYVCQDDNKIYLRMSNNTFWHISISSSLYFPTKNPIRLLNGVNTYAAPNNTIIPSLYYEVEKDELSSIKTTKIPDSAIGGIGHNGGGAWIASQESILFPISTEYLKDGLKVIVKYKYEWEITKNGLSINEPEHRIYFRGGDIGSENTGIESTPCQANYSSIVKNPKKE